MDYDKQQVEQFLYLYENGYHQAPKQALVKCGFAPTIQHATSAMSLMCSIPGVVKKMSQIDKRILRNEKKPLTKAEKRYYLSMAVRNGFKFTEAGEQRNLKDALKALDQLNKMDGDYAPVKQDLTSSDGSMTPKTIAPPSKEQIAEYEKALQDEI